MFLCGENNNKIELLTTAYKIYLKKKPKYDSDLSLKLVDLK
jgi:hypothetical protein